MIFLDGTVDLSTGGSSFLGYDFKWERVDIFFHLILII